MTIKLFFPINISNLYKSLLIHAERPIPLNAIDVYWRTLSIPWPVINRPQPEHGPSEDGPSSEHEDDIAFEDNMGQFKNVFSKASSFVKKSMLTKVRGILQPEYVDIRQHAVQKSTRGRPSAKDKKSQAIKVPDLNEVPDLNDLNDVPTMNHRRSTNSRSTKVPKRGKEPARHSSYTGKKKDTDFTLEIRIARILLIAFQRFSVHR